MLFQRNEGGKIKRQISALSLYDDNIRERTCLLLILDLYSGRVLQRDLDNNIFYLIKCCHGTSIFVFLLELLM